MNLRQTIRRWLERRTLAWVTHRCVVRGFDVVIVNTRPEIQTSAVVSRLTGALALIEEYVPHHYRRLRRDFSGFLVERRAYRGAFVVESRTCLVELTFVVNPAFSLAQVAATILHEAMHARLYACGVAVGDEERHRQERFCRRAEIEFGELVPDGAPVVQRALETLALSDEEIAPVVDPALAARRVAEVDLASSSMPLWLKRRVARQRGLDLSGSDPGAA
jgi:hypothetical protein